MEAGPRERSFDVIVIGGGQAGLAAGYYLRYYLRRTDLSFVILDAETGPGGAWRHTWDTLTLFSPARWSSLPGWIMPGGADAYPGRDAVLAYFAGYEERYTLPIERPVRVEAVQRDSDHLVLETDHSTWRSQAVISATGTWRSPYIPCIPGIDIFRGEQIHSADYRSPLPFLGKRVLIVGGGNSGAQILAEVAQLADATWVTRREPTFLPDDIDGRVLFERATARYKAMNGGPDRSASWPEPSLGDIVMLPPVRAAREHGDLTSVRPFERFTITGVVWPDGREEQIDAVIWCTGFRHTLDHLGPLGVTEDDGRVLVDGTRSVREPRLWLVGYGEWTGFASATIIGVGRTARSTVEEIARELSGPG